MSSTNKTTNYELPQWLGTDKPTFLGDLNGAFLAIDTAMKDNATAASGANTLAGTADGKADANALAIQSLDTQINTPGTGLAADVAANALAIQGVSDKVGSGTLDTTAQDLIGAVNELDAGKAPKGNLLKFNGSHNIDVTADGTKSVNLLMNELHDAYRIYIQSKGANYLHKLIYLELRGIASIPANNSGLHDSYLSAIAFTNPTVTSTNVIIEYATVSSDSKVYTATDGTIAATGSTVPNDGVVFSIVIEEYETV